MFFSTPQGTETTEVYFVKILKNLLLSLLVLSLSGSSALADIVLVNMKNEPSGEFIRVIREGNALRFPYYSGGNYIKNLGNKNSYSIESIQKYHQSLPEKISYDKVRRLAFRVSGSLLGVYGGILLNRTLFKIDSNIDHQQAMQRLVAWILIGPALVAAGGFSGYWAAGKADEYFFVSAERHEVRAMLTSPAIWNESRVVLKVESPLEAVAELEAALSEIH